MDRRHFLLIPFAGIPTAAYARFIEPGWLELAHERIALRGLQPGEPVRMVQLTDLHASHSVPRRFIEHAIDLALAQRPDLICLTGDYITEGLGYDAAWYRRQFNRLTRVPCFATLGNHDGGAWSGRLAVKPYTTDAVLHLLHSAGIRVLMNEMIEVAVRHQRLRLAGVGDYWARQCIPELAFRDARAVGPPIVVLSHNPDSKFDMEGYPWQLMLSGHTHGGQVVCPIFGFSPAPVVDHRYIKGLKPWNGKLIYVSAGVGNIDGFRFNCRPQINVIELHAG